MMNRGQMLSILNSMSEDNLMKAMSAVGIECGADEGYDLGEEEAQGIQSWNARDVSVPEVVKPPLIDKSVFTKPAAQPQMQREYMSDETDMGPLGAYAAHQMHNNQGGW